MSKSIAGITLIELIIAVAVVAILTSIAIPAYNGYIRTSRFVEANNEIAAIKLAQEEYYLTNNTYFDIASGDSPSTESGGLYTTTDADLDYFNMTVTNDPCGNISICYRIIATGKGKMAGETVTFDGP